MSRTQSDTDDPQIGDSQTSSGAPTHLPGYGEIAGFALPIMGGMMMLALLTVVDAAFVGQLGTAQLAALGLAGVFYFMLLVLFVGLMRNSIAFMARAHGAGAPERIGNILTQYQWVAVVAFPLLWGIAQSYPLVLRLCGIDPQVSEFATIYLNIRVWDIPFALTVILYGSLYQSRGDSRFPAAVQFATVLLNVVLDYALIFGAWGFPELGMAGSAWATLLAQALACAFMLIWVHSRPVRLLCQLRLIGRPNWPLMKEVLQIGVPQGLGDFAEIGAFTVFFFIVGTLGPQPLAANNIGIQATHLLFMPCYALGIATASYVGRFLGQHNPGVAERTAKRTIMLGMTYMALSGIPLWFFGESVARLFTRDPEVIILAGQVFKVMALYQAFDGLGIVTRGALSGAGDTLVPTLIIAFTALLVLYPLAIWLSHAVEPGVVGAWIAAMVYLIVLGLLIYWRFQRGAWKRVRIDLAPEA